MMPLPRPSGGSPRGHPAHGGKTPVSTLDEAADPATPAIAFLVARVAGVGSCSACWRWDALFRDPSHSRCPRPASFASTQGGAAPGNAGNGSLHPSPPKKKHGESLSQVVAAVAGPGLPVLPCAGGGSRCRCCRSGLGRFPCAGVAAAAGAAAALPVCSSVRCRCRVRWRWGDRRCWCGCCPLPPSPWQPWRRVLVPVPGTGSPAFAGCFGGGGGVSCF